MEFGNKRRLQLIGAATAVCLLVGTISAWDANADTAVVSRVVDGDTVEVLREGRTDTIRLLNVDTPETKDPNRPVECLGPEATDFLRQLLPPGTEVKLRYDLERTDKYGRTLAAVYTARDVFVSAEIARHGYGVAVQVGENAKFYSQVQSAQNQARSAEAGLYSPTITCTAPGQVAETASKLQAAVESATGTTATEAAAGLASLSGVIAAAEGVKSVVVLSDTVTDSIVWVSLSTYDRLNLGSRLARVIDGARAREADLRTERDRRKAAEVRAEARAETQRKATAARADSARKAAEKVADEARRRSQVRPEPRPATAPVQRPRKPYSPPRSTPPPAQSSPGSPAYTGPRCYAPGGKTWKPC